MSRLLLASPLLGLALGCAVSNSKIGTPCDNAAQCGGDLICDVHDGQGTCQEPHDHGDDHASETDHHATEDTEHHATEPTEATGHHATEDTEHGHATEDTEHSGTGTTA